MNKFAKYFAVTVAGVVLVFVSIVAFSSAETKHKCTGTITEQGVQSPMTIYVKFAEYRWWVGLWSRSDGAVWLEIPHKTTEYYESVSRSGDSLLINASSNKLGVGGLYSKLSNSLSLQTPMGVFDGNCKRIDA